MIVIVDFGSQFTQLIARRIRENFVYSAIIPFTKAAAFIQEQKKQGLLEGVILSGGPHSVYDTNAPQLNFNIEALDVPVLGICYGLQLINHTLKGEVAPAKTREYGYETVQPIRDLDALHPLKGLAKNTENVVWMSHGDEIKTLSQKLEADAFTSNGTIASFHHKERPIFGLQFHPEVEHSQCGREIIKHFIEITCKCQKTWSSASHIEKTVEDIHQTVSSTGKDTIAICALSGGVDSCVAAVLAQKALGNRLECLFINTGLLRQNEYETVLEKFKKTLNLNVRGVDASQKFLNRLHGVCDPEQKRKIIGNTFIEVFEEESKHIPNAKFLVQGTLYPDVIESVSIHGSSVTIKTHHNVGGLPEKMKFKLIEPLRELFKDEVRKLGRELKIPEDILMRHPFPGPGLALRVLGDVTERKLEIVRQADFILVEELKKENLYHSVWQALVVLLDVKSVGVMGDNRTYENVAAIRCVNSVDGMTATWSPLPHEFLAHVSTRIINEVQGINRVVYDISTKPPATIEWE